MRPVHHAAEETHQHVEQQRRPELLADGVLAVAEEVAELQGLLDLLEEHFDTPARLIEFAHTRGAPFGVVGDEDHHDLLAIHTHDHFHPSDEFGMLGTALRSLQQDQIITQDPPLWLS